MVRGSPESPRMMTAQDVADYLSVSVTTVRRMSDRGDIPQPVRLSSGVVRWDRRVIDAWLDQHKGWNDDPYEVFERWAKENHTFNRLVIRFEGRRLLTWGHREPMRAAPYAVVTSALTRLGIGDGDLWRLATFVLAQPAPRGGTIGEMKDGADVELTMREGEIALNVRETPHELVSRRMPGLSDVEVETP